MSILAHKKFDIDKYKVPDHVRPRKCHTVFNISDVRYFKHDAVRQNEDNYMNGEIWLDTNYMYDGHPVAVWLDVGKDEIWASEVYVDETGDSRSTNAEKYGSNSFPNIQGYNIADGEDLRPSDSIIVENNKGETMTSSELMGLAREYGMQHINEPHVMCYEEYRAFREVNESKMGPYQDGDYDRYISDVCEDMAQNRTKYIGKYTTPDSACNLYLDDPQTFAEYEEWMDSHDIPEMDESDFDDYPQ